MYNEKKHWLVLGLLSIILSYFTLLNTYAQGTNSIDEKNYGHFIRRWLALGPFIEGKSAPEAIEVDYLLAATGIPESKFATLSSAPKAGDIVSLTLSGYATQERIWKVLSLPENGDVNEMLVVEGDIDHAAAYLLTFIELKEATLRFHRNSDVLFAPNLAQKGAMKTKRRELRIGSDDAVKVWLNGEVMHTVAFNRALVREQDRMAVDLKRGMNCLMVKVAESMGDWQLTARFDDESGLQFFDTPSRKLVPLGKRPIRLPNPQLETLTEGFWKTYQCVDGLASNWVSAIMQDTEGVIWFGTDGGVSRFDGVSWKTYNQEDGLAGDDVRAITQDKEGVMWFGTDVGVSRFDGKSWKIYTQEDGLAGDDVRAITQDKEGVMWFGTDVGVSRFDGKSWKIYTQEDGLAGDDIRAITQDKEGAIWIGAGGGVSRFDGRSWKTYTQQDGLASYWVSAIVQDTEGVMWFGTSGGVSRFEGKSWKTYTQKDGLAGNDVRVIIQDKEGAMWLGTFGGGVSRFDGRSWETYTQKDGLADNDVRVIIQDKEGVIWVGTNDGGGVSRFDGKSWKTYTFKDGLAGGDVYAIMPSDGYFVNRQDKEGAMWFGTDTGVSKFDGKSWENHYWSYPVRAIAQDRGGLIWAGTDGGVRRFDGLSWETYTQGDGLADNRVNAIMPSDGYFVNRQDREGVIWFGTGGGVSWFDGKSWETYTQKDGLADNRVNAITQDKEGVIWFGTDGGVSSFDGKGWRTYTQKDGLADNRVNAIMQDREGVIWFGTKSSGASRFDDRCFQTLDSRDGLVNDTVYSVCMDKRGQIWLGTKGGVARFIPSKSLPSVYIMQMIADETYTNPKGSIQLSSGVHRISLSYHAISFKTRPGAMLYLYQLVGHDKDWQQPTHEETAEYLDLSPGHYTFQVKAVDRDLHYSDPPASLEIIIPPPPVYKRTSFVVTISGVGGVLIIIVIVLAVNQWRLTRAEQLRLQQELDDARQMQTGLLPETAPSVPGFEIHGFSQPAREVGGDFYDYLTLDTNLICIALADVSDKGLRAAMNAVMTNGILHEAAKSEPAAVGAHGRAPLLLNALNAGLHSRLQRLTNVAFALFIFDPQAKTLTYANAGQPLPLIKREDDVWEAELIGGIPLGSMADFEYEEKTIELQSSDCIILYTDGISEAMNGAEELYGEERLIEAIRQAKVDISAAEMINRILQDVMEFIGRAEQYDDMTLVVVRCLDDSSNSMLGICQ